MRFSYQARTQRGKIQSGVVEASSKEAAYAVLKAHGLFVTALEEAAPPFYARKLKIFERITRKDIVLFSRQLSIMFKSKVPLVETFKTLARQTKNNNLREKILKLAEEVEGGMALSKALSIFPKLFSPFYVSMVRSGEASGKLTDVFLYLADYLEREYQFRGKIKGAIIYPIFILCVFIIVGVIILICVIPKLTEILVASGKELPWTTRAVMAVSDFLKTRGWILLLFLIGFLIFIWYYKKSKTGKTIWDNAKTRIPILGGFLKKLYLSRIALNLSTLISGGLPITQALEITGEVVGSDVYKEIIFKARDGVKRGETISSILELYPKAITPFFYQMVVVGEKTGTLDTSLINAVDFYQADIDRTIDGFIKLLEPMMIILLGLGVAIMVTAVLMPLYSIGFE